MPSRYALLAALILAASAAEAKDRQHLQSLSQTYKITRKYKSMEGPASAQNIVLLKGQPSELLWITGFRTEIVGKDGTSPMSPEFMCHINLDVDIGHHKELFGWTKNTSPRFFTLSQAQFGLDLPEGFGLPVMSDEPFMLGTQVLNHNFENPNYEVRHKVTVDFVRDRDLTTPLKPLFPTNAFGMKLIEGKDGRFGTPLTEPMDQGVSCMPGQHAPAADASSMYSDNFERKFSGHWVVKPGREVNHTNVTESMNIPFDTRIHYINIHLHPFAESLELRDLTAGKSLFLSHVTNPTGRIGLEEVESYSSAEGIPVFKSHQYELVSTYNNTSKVDQDAMATMFFYLFDNEFKKPDPALAHAGHSRIEAPTVAASDPADRLPPNDAWLMMRTNAGDMVLSVAHDVAPETVAHMKRFAKTGAYDGLLEKVFKETEEAGARTAKDPVHQHAPTGPRVVLRTAAGDLVLGLYPDVAPKTVAHILELAKAGAYDTTHFYRVEPGYVLQTTLVQDRSTFLNDAQWKLIGPVPLEASKLEHTRGVLSLAHETEDPDSGDSSFSILLGAAPELDGKYAIFGRVEAGLDVLAALEKAPHDSSYHPNTRLDILKAEVVEPAHLKHIKLAGAKALAK